MSKTLLNLTKLYDAAEEATKLGEAIKTGCADYGLAGRVAALQGDILRHAQRGVNAVHNGSGTILLGRTSYQQFPLYWHNGDVRSLVLNREGAATFTDIQKAQQFARSVVYPIQLEVLVEIDEQAFEDIYHRARQQAEEDR